MSTSRPSARTLSTIDLVLAEIDHALRTVRAGSPGGSPSPADAVPEAELNAA
jgi:hypothetical protein